MNRPLIYIVAEGKDSYFLEDFISIRYPNKTSNIDYLCIYCGGYTQLNAIRQKLRQNAQVQGINLLIFDADTTGIEQGGVSDRTNYLFKQAEDLEISIHDIFLFPDNKRDGEYEDLLEVIASDKHQQVISEYHKFEEKLKNILFPFKFNPITCSKYQTPDKKTLIYTYAHILKYSYKDLLDQNQVSKKNKDLEVGPKFCFKDPDFWNLEHRALDPLKEFLDQYLL